MVPPLPASKESNYTEKTPYGGLKQMTQKTQLFPAARHSLGLWSLLPIIAYTAVKTGAVAVKQRSRKLVGFEKGEESEIYKEEPTRFTGVM